MKRNPLKLIERPELNLRQGIKSSLKGIRTIVALIYILYLANDKHPQIVYSEEYLEEGNRQIRLNQILKNKVATKFPELNLDGIEHNALFTAQLEPLQVGIELFLKLGKIIFADPHLANNSERTGRNRYKKIFKAGTNLKLMDIFLSAYPLQDVLKVLSAWLQNGNSDIPKIDNGLNQILTIFSEETKFKIRTDDGEIEFQQEGIYKPILAGNTVTSNDIHESVGPFRIFKSFVKEDLHPYIIDDRNNGFQKRSFDRSLGDYTDLVSTSLDLIPKRTVITIEINEAEEGPKDIPAPIVDPNKPRQMIYYGCPGSGKSTEVNELVKDHPHTRIIFHPDTDYASFVGCYKPTMENDRIIYRFVAQPFIKAYIEAWKSSKPYYLVIEEINRGNCAQIFGDLFQLLDRKNGVSEYPIEADADLTAYIRQELGESEGIRDDRLRLPQNLFIYATMNTSDQSLFPMDSAFKRRWEWKYVPINYRHETSQAYNITIGTNVYEWHSFLKAVNDRIRQATDSEDKQIGNFFIKGSVNEEDFKNKIMFYLWSEVCKEEYGTSRNFFRDKNNENREFTFTDLFTDKDTNLLQGFMAYLGVEKNPEKH